MRKEVIGDCELWLGDCREVMAQMGAGGVDAVCADPPSGIGFMNKDFDTFPSRERFIDFLSVRMSEAFRCLKPCHYALVWAIPRTSHWTGWALEEAGFEIRDVVHHLFGTGFPKGKGCLKPAAENWILCRRPGRGVRELGIDECRIPTNGKTAHPPLSTSKHEGYRRPWNESEEARLACEARRQEAHTKRDEVGRWPANLVLSHHEDCRCVVEEWLCVDGCPVKAFEVYGERGPRSGRIGVRGCSPLFGQKGMGSPEKEGTWPDDPGGTPARFFYTAKASRSERWFYCRDCLSAYHPAQRDQHGHGHCKPDGSEDWSHLEAHPTQKSLALMEWLVRLISKPGDVILDPFAGSFSTAIACIRSGRKFIGVEQNLDYFTIGFSRIRAEYERSPLFATSGTE